jgi:hypothetical protein
VVRADRVDRAAALVVSNVGVAGADGVQADRAAAVVVAADRSSQ